MSDAKKTTIAARVRGESCESTYCYSHSHYKDIPLTATLKSLDPNNQVFALIRSLGTAGPLKELAAQRQNIHIIITDISDPIKLDEAAAQVSKVTAGSLDVLILNAGSAGPDTAVLPPSAL